MNKQRKHGVAVKRPLIGSSLFYLGFPAWCLSLICILLPVSAFGQMTSVKTYKKILSKDMNNGRGNASVGMASVVGNQRGGPVSFSVDAEGNIYIPDTVNQSVQIFSLQGIYQYEIVLKAGTAVSDIAVDLMKNIYIFDDIQGKLHQYDKKGSLITTIGVDITRWSSRGPLHIVNNEIYIRSSDQEDIHIGSIVKDTLIASTVDLTKPVLKGIHGASGRRYYVKVTRLEKGTIEIENGVTSIIDVPLKGIVSIRFLHEDKNSNFYVQTERLAGGMVILEVQKFTFNGVHLNTVLIPENNYTSWTVKLLSIDESGLVYQFLPANGMGRLNIFREQ